MFKLFISFSTLGSSSITIIVSFVFIEFIYFAFNIDDVNLIFEKDAIEEIADEAIRQKTGARGLRTIVEKMLMDVMFKIPDIKGKKTFTVTKKIVQGKEKNIEALIKTDGAAIESA